MAGNIWHGSSRSGEAGYKLLYSVYLLTEGDTAVGVVCSDRGSGVGEETESGTAKFRTGSGAEETQDNRCGTASVRTMYVLVSMIFCIYCPSVVPASSIPYLFQLCEEVSRFSRRFFFFLFHGSNIKGCFSFDANSSTPLPECI